MKLQFDPNQDYQKQASNTIVDIFVPLNSEMSSSELDFTLTEGSLSLSGNGVGNNIVLTDEQILKNVQEVQQRNDIEAVDELDGMNFSIEMETGTGKTYVYLRTIYELNKQYGFKKFVIVVPKVAIWEGVLRNLEIIYDLFHNSPLNFYKCLKINYL